MESVIVNGIINRLLRANADVFDWRTIEARKPYTENPQVNDAAALFMSYGVKKADWLILVVEPGVYGGMVELGMAIAHADDPTTAKHITVALPSDHARESVFFAHPDVEVVTLDELYCQLDELLRPLEFEDELAEAEDDE